MDAGHDAVGQVVADHVGVAGVVHVPVVINVRIDDLALSHLDHVVGHREAARRGEGQGLLGREAVVKGAGPDGQMGVQIEQYPGAGPFGAYRAILLLQAEEAGEIHALALGYPGRGDDALGGADGLIELEGQAGENKGQALVKAQGVESAAGRVDARLSDLCDKVQLLYNDESVYVYKTGTYDNTGTSYVINHFTDKNALMVTTMFYAMELNYENLGAMSYGIAPLPKFH